MSISAGTIIDLVLIPVGVLGQWPTGVIVLQLGTEDDNIRRDEAAESDIDRSFGDFANLQDREIE